MNLRKYFKVFCLFLFLFGSLIFAQEKQFRVESISDNTITINAGVRDGVKRDFSGQAFWERELGGRKVPVYTCRFKIISVKESTSNARIETRSPSDPIEKGQKVKFDQVLIAPGKLIIRSNPSNARVYLNSVSEGNTPLDMYLDPGSYNIRTEKSEYKPKDDRVNIISGQSTRKDYRLEPIPTPKYRVTINTSPEYAKLYVDGEYKGETPLEVEINKWNFDLRIEKENYETIEKNIILTQQNSEKTYYLEQIKFKISISTNPSWASVYIDGTYIDVSPFQRTLERGRHKISIVKDGYESIEDEIEIKSDIEKTYTLKEINYGRLIISFFPYANVEIDDKFYREVPPLLEVKLSSGRHKIRFYSSKLRKEKTIWVELSKDEEKRIHETFD